MYNPTLDIDSLLFILELIVLLFLIWHLRELGSNTSALESAVKEMHDTHKEMHKDTKIIKKVVDRLEKDMKKISSDDPKEVRKRTKRKK